MVPMCLNAGNTSVGSSLFSLLVSQIYF